MQITTKSSKTKQISNKPTPTTIKQTTIQTKSQRNPKQEANKQTQNYTTNQA